MNKKKEKIENYEDECNCSCHEMGEEHSMCLSNAKACTYSRQERVEE